MKVFENECSAGNLCGCPRTERLFHISDEHGRCVGLPPDRFIEVAGCAEAKAIEVARPEIPRARFLLVPERVETSGWLKLGIGTSLIERSGVAK